MGLIAGVMCDTCGAVQSWDWAVGKQQITIWARLKGWKIGKYSTCPECVRKTEEAKESNDRRNKDEMSVFAKEKTKMHGYSQMKNKTDLQEGGQRR